MKKSGESFEAALHKNERISNIEKFTYLIGYLKKASLQPVQNFALKNDSCMPASELLKER